MKRGYWIAGGAAFVLAAGTAIWMTAVPPAASAPPAQLLAMAASRSPVVLDESFTGVARLAVGGQLEIHLKAQFGTGYSWALVQAPAAGLKSLGDSVLPSPKGGPQLDGGWETQVFSFEATGPGDVQLDFVYRQPWVANTPPQKRQSFHVHVTG